MTATKTISMNIFFHFVFLGLIIKPLLLPNVSNEHWISLCLMFVCANPMVAYIYDWDMNFGAACVPPSTPKYKRLPLFVLFIFGYLLAVLMWLGEIVPVPRENTGMVLGYLYSVVV